MASIRQRGIIWYVRYRDVRGRQHEVKAGPARETAQEIADHLEGQVRMERNGVLPVDAALWAHADLIPLSVLLDRWRLRLEHDGRASLYIKGEIKKIELLVASIEARKATDLLPDSVASAIGIVGLKKGRNGNCSLSARTLTTYCGAVKRFTSWIGDVLRSERHLLSDLAPPRMPDQQSWMDRRKFTDA